MSNSFAKKFYNSLAWKLCRSAYISLVYAMCERCDKPGYIVHHKIKLMPSNINDPNITLNFNNLEYLCLACHNEDELNEHSSKEHIKQRYFFDSNGNVIPIVEDEDG